MAPTWGKCSSREHLRIPESHLQRQPLYPHVPFRNFLPLCLMIIQNRAISKLECLYADFSINAGLRKFLGTFPLPAHKTSKCWLNFCQPKSPNFAQNFLILSETQGTGPKNLFSFSLYLIITVNENTFKCERSCA